MSNEQKPCFALEETAAFKRMWESSVVKPDMRADAEYAYLYAFAGRLLDHTELLTEALFQCNCYTVKKFLDRSR
jgi:hypothetical protein